MAAKKIEKKMKESEAEERRSQVGEQEASPITLLIEVVCFVQIETYIDAQCNGSYKKKNQNRKAITGVKWKKTKSKSKQGIV